MVYNQKDQKQRSTFIRVTNPPVDCTHLVGLTLSNDDPYSPKPLTEDARAELDIAVKIEALGDMIEIALDFRLAG